LALDCTKPIHEADPFSIEDLERPEAMHDAVRATGSLVWLTRYSVWASAEYAFVQAALSDWRAWSSAAGVGVADVRKAPGWRSPSIILEVDPPDHTRTRSVLTKILSPPALRAMREMFMTHAVELVGRLVDIRTFDAAVEIAQGYPLRVFPDALGLDEAGRENLLPIGDLNFNGFGPRNELFEAAFAKAAPLLPWLAEKCRRDHLRPGSFGAQIYEAADRGELNAGEAALLMRTFLLAGIDTTVGGLGNTLHALATHANEWVKLASNPELARAAFDEGLRYDSPVQNFFRTATRDVEVGSVFVRKDEKVLLMLGGANRDPTKWARADAFDIERRPMGIVAFGSGIHTCVGQMVARLEAECVLGELARRVATIKLTGAPVRKPNNTLRSFESLPMEIVPK
jgi:4-methoxybenzoate monooxygenase (O-demethylating)